MNRIKRGLYVMLTVLLAAAATVPVSAQEGPDATVITSDKLEMVSGKSRNTFFFTGSVRISGNNLDAWCDEMEVISLRVEQEGEQEEEQQQEEDGGTIGQIGEISRIFLKGNVRIEQAGRQAEAGLAEIFPAEGRVILTENPVVKDAEGEVTGHRMELVQGERVARVFGKPDGTERPRLTLPTMPDLGYERDDAEKNEAEGDE